MEESNLPRIRAAGIRLAFAGVEVLKGVDVDLRRGEVHALIGENGAGKSSLAKVVAGVYAPSAGHIELDGKPVVLSGPRQALSLGISLIHQEPLSFPDLEVSEAIFVGHQPTSGPMKTVDWLAMRRQSREILERLGVTIDERAKVAGLSVADCQMIELSSALSHEAEVLIFDETTSSLTPKEVAELFQVMRTLKDQGCAIAFVSHRLEEVFAIADRITVLRDGEKVAERLPAETSPDEIVRLMVGRDLSAEEESSPASVGEPVLEVLGLGGKNGCKEASLTIRAGEVVGLGGLVGAGRTELCRLLFGLDEPTSGEFRLNGIRAELKSPRQAMRLGIAMASEDRQHEGLLGRLSITINTTLPTLAKTSRRGWLNRQAEQRTSVDALKEFHTVYRSVGQAVMELSGGNQQKVVLARCLLAMPKLLILDEPTRGVDVGAKAEVHREIRKLAAHGVAVLMVSSDLPELQGVSDRIVMMRSGRTVAEFPKGTGADELMVAATGQVAVEA